jgi:hypothetical protein
MALKHGQTLNKRHAIASQKTQILKLRCENLKYHINDVIFLNTEACCWVCCVEMHYGTVLVTICVAGCAVSKYSMGQYRRQYKGEYVGQYKGQYMGKYKKQYKG